MLPHFHLPELLGQSNAALPLMFITSACYYTLLYYIYTSIGLAVYSKKISACRKLLFAFICGAGIDTVVMYAIYVLDMRFVDPGIFASELCYDLMNILNPLLVGIFYILAVKVLRLTRSHSLHFVALLYICVLMSRMSVIFISDFIFSQQIGSYNNKLDEFAIALSYIVNTVIYLIAMLLLDKTGYTVIFDNKEGSGPRSSEIRNVVLMLVSSYFVAIIIPVIWNNDVMVYLLLTIVFGLVFAVAVLFNGKLSASAVLAEKDAYIKTLSDSNDQFKLLKHDFYNILSSYGGLIETGDIEKLKKYHARLLNITVQAGDSLDLDKHFQENPALVSLIINKLEKAEKSGVTMRVIIMCSIENYYVDNLDECRAIGCLLDNAIEAAAESNAKRVSLMFDRDRNGCKQLHLTNSTHCDIDIDKIITSGYSTKDGHTGLGLKEARRIYTESGCAFDLSQSENEFSVFVKSPPIAKYKPTGYEMAHKP